MTSLYHCWKWLAVPIYVIQILFFLYCCSGLTVQASTPDPFHKDIKNDDIIKPKNSSSGKGGGKTPTSKGRDNIFTHVLIYLLPGGCIYSLEHLEDFC